MGIDLFRAPITSGLMGLEGGIKDFLKGSERALGSKRGKINQNVI